MTNSANNTRNASFVAIVASAAHIAGADFSERCGVVLRRSEYTVPNTPNFVGSRDVRRGVFIVRLDGGIGSELVTIDQTLDPVSALIEEGDQVSVNISNSVHVESTVAPIFAWGISQEANPSGQVLRSGVYLNGKGQPCTASLVLGDNGLVVAVEGPEDNFEGTLNDRVGVIMRRDVYTLEAHRPSNMPLIGTVDKQRVSLLVRLDGGIGSELVTIDQTHNAITALLEDGDQVSVKLSDNVHVESTVQPVFAWGIASDDASGRTLRNGQFIDSTGRLCYAALVLQNAPAGLVVRETPLEPESRIAA